MAKNLTLDSYLLMGDTYTYLYGEFTYLKTQVNKFGDIPPQQQIQQLLRDLEDKNQTTKQIQHILLSIFYLILDYNEEEYETGLKYLKFKIIAPHAKILCSQQFIITLLEQLKLIQTVAAAEDTEEEDGFSPKKEPSPKSYQNMKLKLTEKILQDLAVVLVLSNHNFFENRSNTNLTEELMDYCLDGINQSMSNTNIHINRYTKLYLSLLQIRFTGYEEIQIELDEEKKVARLEEVKSLVESDILDFSDMALFSRVRRAEEMYLNMLSKPSNPLAKTIIVGCLRAVLKLATLNKIKASQDKCKNFYFFMKNKVEMFFCNFLLGFNANMEFQHVYNWAGTIFNKIDKYTNIYRSVVFPQSGDTKQKFIYKILNLDKQDPGLMEEFIEVRAHLAYQKLRAQDIYVYPDPVNEKISKFLSSKNNPNATQRL